MTKLVGGVLLLWGAARYVPREYVSVIGWIGMLGMVMILHFGIFHLLSCGWRTIGVDARPLMNWPLTARNISDFWGSRWNTAFRDLTNRFLFRPLIRRFGPRRALFTGFLASGLIHEAVISIPAGGGYGGPTLFFLIQGAAILLSRTAVAEQFGIRKRFAGWLFAMLALLLPAPMLFHSAFVHEVIVPFMQFIRAIA